jgi:hypothetical protein
MKSAKAAGHRAAVVGDDNSVLVDCMGQYL